ncbi:hypothetical protein HY68_33715 [Streptomyces sp. AcH 505]|uniref:acyl-CoA dehydrogenase family protein n=1 Tax=Streptomyces sp. AcH 505 TaxID=352211 RepID=UPI000591D11A|nr:hypothetical protein HY68_33715 [Streptomyces sp. AcH 505]
MQTTTPDEREEFRGVVRGFLDQWSTEAEVRRLAADPAGHDPEVWRKLTGELGLGAVLVPESAGGQGLSPAEMAVVLEETGRALLCAPVLTSAAVATATLLQVPDGALSGPILAALASGAVATLASDDVPGHTATAAESASGWRLNGAKTRVPDAHIAGRLLVPVTTGSTIRLFAVDTTETAPGITPLAVLDTTRKQFRVDFADTPAQLLAEDFGPGLRAALDTAAIMACAELLGAADKCLELAVAYALDREQFGKPIGSFQAVKHLLADCLAAVEQMRAAVGAAAALAGTGSDPAELAELASVVKSYCSDAAPKVAETLIQVLGGIGFTWEHPAHLYLRRIKSLEVMYGSATEHRTRLARALDLVTA